MSRLSKKKRKEIKDAANSIGAIIAEQMQTKEQPKTQLKKDHPLQGHLLSGDEAILFRKKKLLIIGISAFALCILVGFWVLQIRTMVYDISLTPTKNALSIVGANEELDAVLSELEQLETVVQQNAESALTSVSSTQAAQEQQTKANIQAVLGELIVLPKSSSTSSPE